MVEQVRRDGARRRREDGRAVDRTSEPDPISGRDDTVTLICMCCHPALTPGSSIALTLRAVGGLTTREIAAAFLVGEATMAQRISRAKAPSSSGRAVRPPPPATCPRACVGLPCALPDVQRGLRQHRGTGPDPDRPVDRGHPSHPHGAGRLPEHPELEGLLALMLLTEARRPARTGAYGELIPLERAGPEPVGCRLDRRGRRPDHRRPFSVGPWVSTSSRPPSRPSTTWPPPTPTPTGPGSPATTHCSTGWPTTDGDS